MAPEKGARFNKTYAQADLYALLMECVQNIDLMLEGSLNYAPRPTKDRVYEITHTGKSGWVMVKSNDFIFDLLYADGLNKAVAYNQAPDGSWVYTIGKKSEFVSGFPVGPHSQEGTVLHGLNAVEPGWGGGSTIGGAPRNADGSRSRLTPDEVFVLIEDLLNS